MSTAIKLQAALCAAGAMIRPPHGAAGRLTHSARRALRVGASDTTASGGHQRDKEAAAGLATLAYELLDAHTDTAQPADGLTDDPSWAAHLDYLRALQRKGREMLAGTTAKELSSWRWTDSGSLDVR